MRYELYGRNRIEVVEVPGYYRRLPIQTVAIFKELRVNRISKTRYKTISGSQGHLVDSSWGGRGRVLCFRARNTGFM